MLGSKEGGGRRKGNVRLIQRGKDNDTERRREE